MEGVSGRSAQAARPLGHSATWPLLLLSALLLLPGCGWIAHGLAGGKRTVNVQAQYRGLDGQRVAVLVAANDQILFQHPQAPQVIGRMVSGAIALHVPGVTVTDPEQAFEYQQNNPYWAAVPYGQLVRALDVDRIIVIELSEYRTREPGNAHVWQGVASGYVNVLENDGEDIHNPDFYTNVRVQFPEDSPFGLVSATDEQIQLGTVTLFARAVSGLFHDHQVER